MVKILRLLYNYILERGEIPKQWVEGIINPLHKKGDKTIPDNYRKITVLNSILKLFEIIIHGRINLCNEALDNNDPLQKGFVDDGRTLDNVFILYSGI